MSYFNEDKEECEGCFTRDACELDTSYIDPETNEVIKCPCSICLVKIMCKYSSPCDMYRNYSKAVHKINK